MHLKDLNKTWTFQIRRRKLKGCTLRIGIGSQVLLMAVTLATWEAEIRRTAVQGQAWQTVLETLSPK
jgi:hypothetical protein